MVVKYCTYTGGLSLPGTGHQLVEVGYIDSIAVAHQFTPSSPIDITNNAQIDAFLKTFVDGSRVVSMVDSVFSILLNLCKYNLQYIKFSYLDNTGNPQTINVVLASSNCQYKRDMSVVRGCTDVKAINYNPLATESDDSCVYTPYSPEDKYSGEVEQFNENLFNKVANGGKMCCCETTHAKWLNLIDQYAQKVYSRNTVLSGEVKAHVTLDFSEFDVSILQNQMQIQIVLTYQNGSTEVIVDFKEDCEGMDIMDFMVVVYNHINLDSAGFVATMDLMAQTISIVVPDGYGSTPNEGIVSLLFPSVYDALNSTEVVPDISNYFKLQSKIKIQGSNVLMPIGYPAFSKAKPFSGVIGNSTINNFDVAYPELDTASNVNCMTVINKSGSYKGYRRKTSTISFINIGYQTVVVNDTNVWNDQLLYVPANDSIYVFNEARSLVDTIVIDTISLPGTAWKTIVHHKQSNKFFVFDEASGAMAIFSHTGVGSSITHNFIDLGITDVKQNLGCYNEYTNKVYYICGGTMFVYDSAGTNILTTNLADNELAQCVPNNHNGDVIILPFMLSSSNAIILDSSMSFSGSGLPSPIVNGLISAKQGAALSDFRLYLGSFGYEFDYQINPVSSNVNANRGIAYNVENNLLIAANVVGGYTDLECRVSFEQYGQLNTQHYPFVDTFDCSYLGTMSSFRSGTFVLIKNSNTSNIEYFEPKTISNVAYQIAYATTNFIKFVDVFADGSIAESPVLLSTGVVATDSRDVLHYFNNNLNYIPSALNTKAFAVVIPSIGYVRLYNFTSNVARYSSALYTFSTNALNGCIDAAGFLFISNPNTNPNVVFMNVENSVRNQVMTNNISGIPYFGRNVHQIDSTNCYLVTLKDTGGSGGVSIFKATYPSGLVKVLDIPSVTVYYSSTLNFEHFALLVEISGVVTLLLYKSDLSLLIASVDLSAYSSNFDNVQLASDNNNIYLYYDNDGRSKLYVLKFGYNLGRPFYFIAPFTGGQDAITITEEDECLTFEEINLLVEKASQSIHNCKNE